MKAYRRYFTCALIVLVSLLALSAKDASCFGLKSKVQDEIDQNPFLKTEGIKLRVTKEQKGYVTIEMYEGNAEIREYLEKGYSIADIASNRQSLSKSVQPLVLTMDALQKIDGVKSIMLTADTTNPIDKISLDTELRDRCDILLTEALKAKKKENYSDVIRMSTIALQSEPKCVKAYMMLGASYARQNNISMACKSLEKMVALGKNECTKQGYVNLKPEEWLLKAPAYDKFHNEPCFKKIVQNISFW